MRISSIAPAALLTFLALRPAYAQGTPPRSSPAEPALPAPRLQLEEPKPNQGHFLALGFHGISAMAFDESRGTREPTFGQGVSLRLGESVTNWLSLSLAVALGSTYGERRDSLSLVRFGITSQWYLSQRWFVQAGLGATNARGADPEDYGRTRGRYGDVYLTGLGYDFYLSNRQQSGGWVLSPILTADVGPDSKFTTTSLWLGIEVSWWSGLSRDKLDLPSSKAYKK
jgi:hypothetical protein